MISNFSPELARAAEIMVRDVLLVKKDENVLISADTNSDMRAVDAIQSSAYRQGAKVSVSVIPQLPYQGSLGDPFIPEPMGAAARSCDVWIDICRPHMGGSGIHDASMKNGRTRYYLAAALSTEPLIRIFGKVDLEAMFAFTDAANELVGRSKECRLTNNIGSDVKFDLKGAHVVRRCRADAPGMTAVFGSIPLIPIEESVQGTVKVDAIAIEYYSRLSEPITFKVNGKIEEVSGGGSEGRVLERAMKRACKGEYGNFIHFTHGIHPSARATGTCFLEDTRVIGYDAVGLGVPYWVEGGGENQPDAVMSNQSLWLDGQQIAKDGVIVGPDNLVELGKKLYS